MTAGAPEPSGITATAERGHVVVCPVCGVEVQVGAVDRHLGSAPNGMDLGHTTDIDLSAYETHWGAEHA